MPEIQPRKLPSQRRSRETVDAILEACARILGERGLAGLTTNRIAERAGVSIGSLYEFFPNRESILATLTARKLERLRSEVIAGIEIAEGVDAHAAVSRLLRRIVEVVRVDAALYRTIVREASFLADLPSTRSAIAEFYALARLAADGVAHRLDLPHFEADMWLIARMLANAVLDIALAEPPDPDPDLLTCELARLTVRMLQRR